MRPWLFTVGDFGVPAYWALVMIGFTAAFYLAWREARHDGIDPNRMLDLCLIALVAGLVGARLMHVLVEDDPLHPGRPILDHYLEHPLDMLRMWNGLAFYGGLLLAAPAALLYARAKRMGVARVADVAGVAIPLGLFFGRIGCFLAGCCHGAPTELPWGVTFTHPHCLARPLGVPLHPTQLYAAGLALGLFGLMLLLKRRWRRFQGQVFLSFCLLYSAGRFLIEMVRNDNRGLFFDQTLSASQLIALPLVAVSLVLLIALGRRSLGEGDRSLGEGDS